MRCTGTLYARKPLSEDQMKLCYKTSGCTGTVKDAANRTRECAVTEVLHKNTDRLAVGICTTHRASTAMSNGQRSLPAPKVIPGRDGMKFQKLAPYFRHQLLSSRSRACLNKPSLSLCSGRGATRPMAERQTRGEPPPSSVFQPPVA